ncbi:hypothetical protein NHG86_18310 [Vibrio cholerae]|uniref:hypothetical protein n=1 Tax=Vibrio cholerae TaxID=666 RepID=UPI003530F459
MFGFLRKKAIKVVAVNLYQELLFDQIRGEKFFGRTSEEICTSTGLNIVAVFGMMNCMIHAGLVEEIDDGTLSYRAINIPSSIRTATSNQELFAYSRQVVNQVDFTGV